MHYQDKNLLSKKLLNLDENVSKLKENLKIIELKKSEIKSYFVNDDSWNNTCLKFEFTNNKFWRKEL